MKKIVLIAGSIALAGTATAAFALPERPLNAANVGSGSGCVVTDGDTQAFDPNCSFHAVFKDEKDGSPRFLNYSDRGNLQPGQTAPDQTLILNTELFGGQCELREIVKPSGEYSSTMRCSV